MSADLQPQKETFKFTWKIENFQFNTCELNKGLKSPHFHALPLDGTVWGLNLFPKGKENDKFICCFLHRMDDSGPECVKVDFEFSIVGKDGDTHMPWKGATQEFFKSHITGWGHTEVWEVSSLLRNKDLYFPNDVFTVQCVVALRNTSSSMYQCIARTLIAVEKVSFRRTIKNMNEFNNSSHSVNIPLPFQTPFELVLGAAKDGEDCLSIRIRKLQTTRDNSYFMRGKLSILSADGSPRYWVADEYCFVIEKDTDWQFPSFINNEILHDDTVCVKDSLELLCEFALSDGRETSDIEECEQACSLKANNEQLEMLNLLSKDLESLFSEKTFSDVTLQSEEKTFPVHKALLSARSPVFKAMLDSDMSEKKSGLVNIKDVDYATLKSLLRYMYSGKVEDFPVERAKKLYVAADKYEVLPLKEKCSALLRKNLALDNVCEVLVLADRHKDVQLKEFAQLFIHTHSVEVLASDEWIQLIQSDVALASEMMRKLSMCFHKR